MHFELKEHFSRKTHTRRRSDISVYCWFEQVHNFDVKSGGPLVKWACIAEISGQGIKVDKYEMLQALSGMALVRGVLVMYTSNAE